MHAALLDAAATETQRLLRGVPHFAWDGPGLGEWTLRELAGHTVRALEVIVDYLHAPSPETPMLSDAAEYFGAALSGADATGVAARAGVAARGRERARRFASDDAIADEYTAAHARAVDALLEAASDRLVVSALGPLPLREYVRTRLLETVVHGLDVARATEQKASFPTPCLRAVAVLLAEILTLDPALGERFVLAATGREAWSDLLPVVS